jgi:hypothetical protein
MTKPEYGIWSNIFDLVGYFTLFSGLLPFWATRFAARGKEGAIRTGVSTNLIIAIVSALIYVPIIFPVTNALHISGTYIIVYLTASLQIINVFMISILESCLRAVKPQAIGYGLLIEEVCKISLAFVLIVGLKQLFMGAMVSLVVAALIQTVYYVGLLFEDLKQRIQWNYLKEWLKGSTAIVYNAIGNQLVAFIFILLFLYGGQAARGEYQAASTFANIIGYSASLAFALYPKMLAEECPSDVATSFKTVLMLAFPMATIAITLSASLLTILNASYATASPILILLTLDMFVVVISQFYTSCLLGIERLDEEGKISLRQLVRSKIFKVFTLPYLQATIALPASYYVLTQLSLSSSVQAVEYVIGISIFVHTITLIGVYIFMRKSMKIPVAWKSVGKYILASLATAAVLYLLPQTTTLVATFGKVTAGVATYAASLLAIDSDARILVAQILKEVRALFKGW